MKKWLILFTICLDWSLMWIDFTAVNVALAPIANDLKTTLGTLQWIITAYTLCSAALMAIGGRLGDMYGHKRLFIIGTLIFVISSALAGFAPNISTLILSRIGQGVGIAMVVPITTALVYLLFDEKQKGLALGFLTGTTGVSMAIGPTLGGLIITYLNWRWVFFINIPIGLFAILMALILISETTERKKISIDFLGIITLASGLLSLLIALNKIPDWGISSISFWGLFVIALLLLTIFVFIEKHSRQPLIHIDLLTHKILMGTITLRTCMQTVFFIFMFIISLYMQNILGYTPDKTGFMLLSATILLGILSPFSGHLMNFFSLRLLISSSCFILGISLILLMGADLTHSLFYLITSLMLFGIAFAIHFPTTNIAVLQIAPANQAALVTGMLFTMAFAGASAGLTLSSALLNSLSKYKLVNLMAVRNFSVSNEQQLLMENIASGAQSLSKLIDAFPSTLINQATNITQKSFSFGFVWILVGCVFLSIIALIIAMTVLKNVKTKNKNQPEEILF